MLRDLLKRKKVSMYALSKKSGIPYSTVNYIANGKNAYENCSVQTFKIFSEILGMTMDELYKECQTEEVISEEAANE